MSIKSGIAVLTMALALGAVAVPCQVSAQVANEGKAASVNAKTDQVYLPCGVTMGQQALRPGESLPVVFGVIGPPDQVQPMRSKSKKAEDDYVLFTYYDRFSLHINKQNAVQSIQVFDRNMPLDGVPFKVGDVKATVLAKWGEPDRAVDKIDMYWYRGVYVMYDANEKIESLFFTAPGKSQKSEGGKKAAPKGN